MNEMLMNIVITDHHSLSLSLCSQESPLPKVLNDSGCLLGDNDLFDAQLDDDMAEEVMEDKEEESLDAIRAAVRKKAKNKVRERHKSVKLLRVAAVHRSLAQTPGPSTLISPSPGHIQYHLDLSE